MRRYYHDNILDPYLTPEEDAALVAIFWDEPRLFMESFLWVSNKEKGEMPFIMYTDQEVVYLKIQQIRRAKKPVRLICLKSRQVGVSTLIEAFIFTLCLLRPNTQALIVAQKQTTADKVYDMFTLFWERLPEAIRPKKRRKTVGMMVFDNKSSIETATAKNTDPSRGFALNCGHFSEFSFWPFPEATLHGIMGGFSEGPESFAAIESTANGMEGLFYTMWQMAVDGIADGDQMWTPIFLAWWQHDQYELPVSEEESRTILSLDEMSDAERKLVQKWLKKKADDHGCYTFEQWQRKIKWRRRKVASDFGGSDLWFAQEYPASPEEAFLAQGQSIYDLDAINWYMENHVREGNKGHLQADNRGRPYFVEGPDGDNEFPLTIWHRPTPGEEYSLGADSALGSRQKAQQRRKKTEGDEGDGDYSAIEVFSVNRVQCAEFRKRTIDPAEFAEMLVLLARYFSDGLIVPEVGAGGGNSSGFGMQYHIKQIGYPRIWRWQRFDDAVAVAKTKAIGWEATPKAVSVMQKSTMRELRRGAGLLKAESGEIGETDRDWPRMVIHSRGLLIEMTSYKMNIDGDMGAQKGKHDDRVRAWGLSILGMDQLPPPTSVREKEEARNFVQDLPYDRFGRNLQPDPGGAPAWLRY